MAAHTLDVRDVSCPMPIVRTSQAMQKLGLGDTLEVLATDRGALSDVPAWCTTTGNELVEQSEEGGVFRFVLRKAPRSMA
ncbi:MAG: sulfurtransferase TusA family protein [Actinomycetota bacterium]|nr:sulfurtransferase TusA family protein [Actinomycetota bacterium]